MSKCLRVTELFAGIGAQASALERLGIVFQSTVCEIDPHAYKAYCAIHGDTPNLGDITKVEHLPESDLLTYSFPCQDLSIAGKQMGMEEGSGTRSSLLWEVDRLLTDAKERGKLPEVLLMENVDAILNKKNKPYLDKFIARLRELGYESSYAVLNAKDFGIPQNRKRCFMVSALTKGRFIFPQPFPLEKRLKDVLEEDVPESFYLKPERTAHYKQKQRIADKKSGQRLDNFSIDGTDSDQIRMVGSLGNGYGMNNNVYDPNGIAPTQRAQSHGNNTIIIEPIKSEDGTVSPDNCNAKIMVVGDLHLEKVSKGGIRNNHSNVVLSAEGISTCITAAAGEGGGHVPKIIIAGDLQMNQFDTSNRVYDSEGIAPTILGRDYKEPKKIVNQSKESIQESKGVRIRYLTPRECLRLMGQTDDAIDKIVGAEPAKTTQYRLAGNSIVVNVLMAIFKGIYMDNDFIGPEPKQKSLGEFQ